MCYASFRQWGGVLVLLGTGACVFDISGIAGSDAALPGPSDAVVVDSPDAAVPDAAVPDAAVPDAQSCMDDVLGFEPSNVDICAIAPLTGDFVLNTGGTWIFRTNNGVLTAPGGTPVPIQSVLLPQPNGPDLRVVSMGSLILENSTNLRINGSSPVALVARMAIRIEGGSLLAAGALDAAINGPGGGACTSGGQGIDGQLQTEMGGVGDSGGSGGSGGGFGDIGGQGNLGAGIG